MSEAELRLDDLAKTAAGRHSRRTVIKAGLGFVAAAIAGTFPGRARAASGGGNSGCAHFCQSLPPGQRGACVEAAAHGDPTGFCSRCAGDVTRICGDPTRQVCCNAAAGQLCCPTQAQCLTCAAPKIPDLVNCRCVCPPGTTECGAACCPTTPQMQFCRGGACTTCANPQTCGGGGTCPSIGGTSCHCANAVQNPGQIFCQTGTNCAVPPCTADAQCQAIYGAGARCVQNCCGQVCAPPCGTRIPGITAIEGVTLVGMSMSYSE